jgi:hypothetical protein
VKMVTRARDRTLPFMSITVMELCPRTGTKQPPLREKWFG